MKTITFDNLKKLLTEGFDEPTADDWQWCVANISKSKYDTATYDDSEPWPNDLSAYELPRGNWMGFCRTETKEDAEELLGMMREYDAKRHVRPYHYQYAVVSRRAFEANCFRNTGNWDDDLPGAVYQDKNYNRHWGVSESLDASLIDTDPIRFMKNANSSDFLKIIWHTDLNKLIELKDEATKEYRYLVGKLNSRKLGFMRGSYAYDKRVLKVNISLLKEVIDSKQKDPDYIPDLYK